MAMSVFIPFLRIGSYDNNIEEKVDKILHQVSEMRAQLHQLTDTVRKFEKCKACKKRYYKSVDNGDVSFEDKLPRVELTPLPSVSAPPKASASNSPVTSLTPLQPKTTPTQKQASVVEEPQSTMLIGSPSRGVYVPKKKVEQLPQSTPKLFALKLFELVFSREEAKMDSVEGKADKLCKLDPSRMAAVGEHTERMFSADDNLKWAEIKKSIDEKCRMVQNKSSLQWAGVNMSKD